MEEIVYRVDAAGIIVAVNEEWDRFAAENDAPELLGSRVVGRRMSDFISGADTQLAFELLKDMATLVRPIIIPFRCDDPGSRRHMEMRVTAAPGDEVEFRTRIVGLEARPTIRLIDRQARRDSARMVALCAWCNRGKFDGEWMELEELVHKLQLFDSAPVPEISHGMCDGCQRTLKEQWGVN